MAFCLKDIANVVKKCENDEKMLCFFVKMAIFFSFNKLYANFFLFFGRYFVISPCLSDELV